MSRRIVVIGAGIAGLAAAHKLAKDNHEVTLIEASDQLGGLGTYFKSGDNWVDKFYHCQMPSDDPLLSLIEEVGLKDRMYWKPTRMGFIVDGKRYPFNTAVDLLRFTPLSLFDRIRLGVMSLLVRRLGEGKDLDNVRIEDWFSSMYGAKAWKKILAPLFTSKFGDHGGSLPALYIWQRLGREKNVATRGYLSVGVKGLIDAIDKSIRLHGGEIRTNTQVQHIDQHEDTVTVSLGDGTTLEADWVISTVPLPLFATMVEGSSIEGSFRNPKLKYQGVVNALFFLKRPLDGYYWNPVVNSNTEFDGVVEMSELVNTSQYGGRHLIYVMKYCERSSDLFAEEPGKIGERWKHQLIGLYPDLGLVDTDFDEVQVFKAPFVEPIYPLGYTQLKPDYRVGNSRVLLATSAQVYPNITSWNASTGLANEVVERLYRMDA